VIPFAKYSGCGNDFVLIDNRYLQLIPSKEGIRHLCHRQCGIGADGLIFLENPTTADARYRMRIFNADSSEAEMCGNGLRCLAKYISSLETHPERFLIETMHQQMEISFSSDCVNIGMPSPSSITSKKIAIDGHDFLLYCLDTGVPHAVYFTDTIENEKLFSYASKIRHHKAFHPRGANVNFVKILPDQSLSIRTFERGVEQETLACGTGATAAAIAFADTYERQAPVKVNLRSGDSLSIHFKGKIPFLSDLVMSGPATKVFEGTFNGEMFGFRLKSSMMIL
jgi:diaminopimelate epimerase